MNDIDKQVLEYLNRARSICDPFFYKYRTQSVIDDRIKQIIEIAKLIQLEEHHQFQIKGKMILDQYSKLESPLINYEDEDDI